MYTPWLLHLSYLEMTANNQFVTVRKSCLDLLWQHCHHCPEFGDQERAFVQKCHTETPYAPPREEPTAKKTVDPAGLKSSPVPQEILLPSVRDLLSRLQDELTHAYDLQ